MLLAAFGHLTLGLNPTRLATPGEGSFPPDASQAGTSRALVGSSPLPSTQTRRSWRHVPADPHPVSRRRLHYALGTPPRPSSPPLHSSEKWLSRARPVTNGRRHEAPARGGLPPARLQAAPPGRCPRLAPFSWRHFIPTVRPAPLHPLAGSGHSPHLYPRWPSARPPAAEHTPIRPSISPAENSPPPPTTD